jgi:hypothetical protein
MKEAKPMPHRLQAKGKKPRRGGIFVAHGVRLLLANSKNIQQCSVSFGLNIPHMSEKWGSPAVT